MPPRPLTKTPERDVLKAVTDLLSAHKIWWVRMNTGAISGVHNGKRRFFRFGRLGMADVLAMPHICFSRIVTLDGIEHVVRYVQPLWIECKAPGGKQSADQKAFESEVVEEKHKYLLVRDVDALIAWLREYGIA